MRTAKFAEGLTRLLTLPERIPHSRSYNQYTNIIFIPLKTARSLKRIPNFVNHVGGEITHAPYICIQEDDLDCSGKMYYKTTPRIASDDVVFRRFHDM